MAPGREMRFWGWGEDAHAGAPPQHGIAWLEEVLGAPLKAPRPTPDISGVQLSKARLTRRAAAALRAIVGEGGLLEDDRARIVHAAGKGYPDLVRLSAGDARPAPDAVALPGDGRAGRRGARRLRPGGHRRRPLRRWNERRRRRRARARRPPLRHRP